ncbi:hypothetical protein GOP47_0015371 [Adiantum capillus-veneris]|uniref:Uncharacterized protein n=1 Tax=Adiantum capillus-veneris TaxID=13818 RepID=A0A9D4ZD50_ADICA|nr:hypothetical protein GOP47_0015371 [Adiantum capillus-veneris]
MDDEGILPPLRPRHPSLEAIYEATSFSTFLIQEEEDLPINILDPLKENTLSMKDAIASPEGEYWIESMKDSASST